MNDAATKPADRLHDVGQGHLVDHAATLGEEDGRAFLEAAAAQPWETLLATWRSPPVPPPPVLRPPQALTLKRQRHEGRLRPQLADVGRALLARGGAATVLLAGGQGTRLGFDGPKGTFVFGPEEDRSLYRIQVEHVVATGRRAGRPVPLVVLVSEATETATREALAPVEAWGLDPSLLEIVTQRQLPALDEDGRAFPAAPGVLATAPDGHGGAVGALVAAGTLDRLAARGVEVLTTFQVDNPLARPLDPVMLGWMGERHAQAVGKAVARGPEEKVGVFARDIQGRTRVVEYSEFPEGGMPDDLDMGSIALHAFSLPWLRSLLAQGLELPLHRAHKKVPYWTPGGIVVPEAPNATKFERFIFDLFPLADRVEVHEVVREREFAPVKNASGVDSPETARALVAAEVRRWYEERGRTPPDPPSLQPLAMTD
jgi:UDP-N-acetylglucosamine/UDP-N-acetylgalactosamine diphosphorylase